MSPRRKKYRGPAVAPDFLEKQKESLRRSHRQVILFNEKEISAIDEYCRLFKVSSKSSFLRQAIMERVLEGLDEKHPTLF